MLFTTKWLRNIFKQTHGDIKKNIMIQEVNTDSRKNTIQSLFIPIIGESFDGHNFLRQAIENGASATLWQQDKPIPSFIPADFPIFLVKDTVKALQQLASSYRDEINPIVIAITGSNGKTTTKDIVASIVKTTYVTHATKGNLNNHIGLPLTILDMKRNTEVLVVEMGMNHFNEIDVLTKIAKPNYAIITHIGESHIEFLGSREGIAKAKLEITNGLQKDGKLIIDGDEPLLQHMHDKEFVTTCGYQKPNMKKIENVKVYNDKTTFILNGKPYIVPLVGNHHAKNASYGVMVGEWLNIKDNKIKEGLLSIKVTHMRFQIVKGQNNVSIINDAYNASPSSMKAAIQTMKQMEGYKEKVLVLGDIFELGDHSKMFHESIAETIESPITALFTFGNNAQFISKEVKDENTNIEVKHYHEKEELIKGLQPYLHDHTLILFKASRGMQFELLIKEIISND